MSSSVPTPSSFCPVSLDTDNDEASLLCVIVYHLFAVEGALQLAALNRSKEENIEDARRSANSCLAAIVRPFLLISFFSLLTFRRDVSTIISVATILTVTPHHRSAMTFVAGLAYIFLGYWLLLGCQAPRPDPILPLPRGFGCG